MNRFFTLAVATLSLSAGLALAQQGNARLRVMHASPDAPAVDIYVNGGKAIEGLPFREYTEYISLPAGTYDVAVKVTGTDTTVLQANPALVGNTNYTVLAVGKVSGGADPLSLMVLTDDLANPGVDRAKFRVVHAAPSAPEVDVYVTTPFEYLGAKDAVLKAVPFKAASGYLTVPVQNYQARVAVAGTKTVAIDSGRIPSWSGMVRTVVAVDAAGGGAPFSLIVLPDFN